MKRVLSFFPALTMHVKRFIRSTDKQMIAYGAYMTLLPIQQVMERRESANIYGYDQVNNCI
jgi:hypothetical protein